MPQMHPVYWLIILMMGNMGVMVVVMSSVSSLVFSSKEKSMNECKMVGEELWVSVLTMKGEGSS